MTARHDQRHTKSPARRSGRRPAGGLPIGGKAGSVWRHQHERPAAATLARRKFALALIGGTFFFLWVSLVLLGQEEFWPLLAAPVLLSAWYFFEAGALATIILTGLLLVQAPFGKPAAIVIAVSTFGLTGLGLGWGQRRQKLAHRHTLRTSVTDSLTGLYNYGYFMECLDRELHRAQRYGGSVTLVMFDIDHFKTINDTYGHAVGDRVLQELVSVIQQKLRVEDILARFGGEEFMLILPGTTIEGALTQAQRLCDHIASHHFTLNYQLTCSFGVGMWSPGQSPQHFLRRVDAALYRAKARGRNRVERS